MAVYKVPQDVEADDKLIGPFSFRQFVYLIVVAVSCGLAWGLAQLFIGLAIIPLPIILFFGALALPLKKDQPMEVYLAAVVSFHLKPKKRLWQPDGIQELVDIVAPKSADIRRTKDLSEGEAEERLSYLAQIADTRGWSVRGINPNSAVNANTYKEAQQATDVLDDTSGVGKNFDNRIAEGEAERREAVITQMHQRAAQTQSTTPKVAPAAVNQEPVTSHDTPSSEILPSKEMTDQTSTSEKTLSPDIINLVNNPEYSVETIAHEAERIHKKEALDDGVVISLR